MAVKNGNNIISAVDKLVQPVADEQGLSIWDTEFVKEGAIWYLRFFIDKPEGITIDDCERFHRRINTILDEADPIDHSYYLEVSSPGIEREIKKPHHFEIMIGKQICIRLIRPDLTGKKELKGILKEYSDGVITLQNENGQIKVNQSETAYVKLAYDYDEIDNIGGSD